MDKCLFQVGLVMGKGGETIKAICAQSGAHCQVDKTAPEGAREKSIVIKVCLQIWWKFVI